MEKRIAKIEEKLDKIHQDIQEFIQISACNKSDISWLKGIARINFALFSSALLGIVGWALKVLIK